MADLGSGKHLIVAGHDLRQQETFQDLIRDWLKNAPWLMVSIVVHAVILLIIFNIDWRTIRTDMNKIIRADYDNVTEPAQAAPGPASYFYNEKTYRAYTDYDPDRANHLLDEIGLNERDLEGYRKLPNGNDMTFLMNFTSFTGIGPGQFIVDDWAAVGVRLVIRELANNLYYAEKEARKVDFTVWSSNGEFFDRELSSSRLTTHGACGSNSTRSAGAPGIRRPHSRPSSSAGPALIARSRTLRSIPSL